MKTLIVFDLDGTLTLTTSVDEGCFVQAVQEHLGCEVDTNWARYPHVTDQGCWETIYEETRGGVASPEDVHSVRERFLALLREQVAADPGRCCEVPGAATMLAYLTREAGCAVAIATGAWKESAALKLAAANLADLGLPLASSSDAPSRSAIVTTAIERAKLHYGTDSFNAVVAVGDAVWDFRTAELLRLPFVGIAQDENANRLRAAGVRHIVPDYRQREGFVRLLTDLATA